MRAHSHADKSAFWGGKQTEHRSKLSSFMQSCYADENTPVLIGQHLLKLFVYSNINTSCISTPCTPSVNLDQHRDFFCPRSHFLQILDSYHLLGAHVLLSRHAPDMESPTMNNVHALRRAYHTSHPKHHAFSTQFADFLSHGTLTSLRMVQFLTALGTSDLEVHVLDADAKVAGLVGLTREEAVTDEAEGLGDRRWPPRGTFERQQRATDGTFVEASSVESYICRLILETTWTCLAKDGPTKAGGLTAPGRGELGLCMVARLQKFSWVDHVSFPFLCLSLSLGTWLELCCASSF